MKGIGLFLALSLPLWALASPTVTNIRASQRENTKLVDIYYDVAYSGSSNVSITCEVSTNSGASYNVPAESFSGDYGAMVSTGTDRLIVWNAGVDWDENYSEQVRVRITANAPRFTDNGDGSITDNKTGLIWKKKSGSNMVSWRDVTGSLYGDWRLPTVAEVESLLDMSRIPHLPKGHPFDVPVGEIFWTADIVDSPSSQLIVKCFSLIASDVAFSVNTYYGGHFTWPVRSAD